MLNVSSQPSYDLPGRSIGSRPGSVRQRLLGAARGLLRQQGYDHFTVAEVAARSGLSRRTIYNQFDDREALYRASRHELLMAFEEALPRELPPHVALEPTIERFCTDAIAALSTPEHRELWISVQRDGGSMPWLRELYRTRVERTLRLAVEHYLLMQKTFGGLDIGDPAPLARALLTMIKATVSAADTALIFDGAEIALIFARRIEAKKAPRFPAPADQAA